jgi:nitrate reductase gamma subunit
VNALRTIVLVAVPYSAMAIFLVGVAWRVLVWAQSPVPFRIPTTCGQQKSLPWIRSSWLECPHTTFGAVARVASEVLLFRSLFRNHAPERNGFRLVYSETRLLWLGALSFHWSLLAILVRHLRLFLVPVPKAVLALQAVDGFLQFGIPVVYLSDAVLLAALLYLAGRRIVNPRLRYLSLAADHLALLLLLSLAVSGMWMRYVSRIDVAGIKQYAMGLVTFSPVLPREGGALFYIHVTLVSLLLAWFPFSKLMHMGGIFLSPTRNLANNSRMKRHVNPWNPTVAVHSYEEWEDEFRVKMIDAGLPVEKQP